MCADQSGQRESFLQNWAPAPGHAPETGLSPRQQVKVILGSPTGQALTLRLFEETFRRNFSLDGLLPASFSKLWFGWP